MTTFNSRVALFAIFILLPSAKLYTEQVAIHIGVNIESSEVKYLMTRLQAIMSARALENGYFMNTTLGHPFHITLGRGTIDDGDITKCKKCLESIAKSTNQLDLTKKLRQGEFEVLKQAWGVWSLKEDAQLSKLADYVRDCLEEAGVQLKEEDEFHPHISLGTFRRKNGKARFKLPPAGLQRWTPKLAIKRLEQPFKVKELSLSINRRTPSSFLQADKSKKFAQAHQQAAEIEVAQEVKVFKPYLSIIIENEAKEIETPTNIDIAIPEPEKISTEDQAFAQGNGGRTDLQLAAPGGHRNIENDTRRTALEEIQRKRQAHLQQHEKQQIAARQVTQQAAPTPPGKGFLDSCSIM